MSTTYYSAGFGVGAVTADAPIVSSGGSTPNISIPKADASTDGYLDNADFVTFAAKQDAITPGSVSTTTTGVHVGSGSNSTFGPNVTVNVDTASASQPGLLSAADWITFNSKDAGGAAAAAQAFAIQRANHTGTQLAVTISDFSATAKADVLPTGGTTGQVLAKVDGTNYNVEWIDETGGTPSGTPNTFAGFDGSGDLYTIPNWNINNSGGVDESITLTPIDIGGVYVINNFQNTITPTADLVNTTYFNMQSFLYINGPFDHHETKSFSTGVEAGGTGDFGYTNAINASIALGDGTNVSTSQNSQLINNYMVVRDNHTAQQNINLNSSGIDVVAGANITGLLHSNYNVNIQGISTGGDINVLSLNANIGVDQPSGTGHTNLNVFGSIDGVIQYVSAINVGYNFNSGAVVTNSYQGHQENGRWYSGSTMNGHTSYSAYPNFDAGATINSGYQVFSASANINADFLGNNVGGFFVNPQVNSHVNSITGFGHSPNLNSGASVTQGIQGYNDNLVVRTGATIADMTSFGAFPTIESGATATTLRAFNANMQVNGTLTQGINMGDWSVQSTTVIPDVTGMRMNFSQAKSAQIMTAYSSSDGRLDIQAKYSSEEYGATPGFIGLNSIGGLFSVDPGFPISNTLTLANSLGVSAVFWDDYGADPFLGTLGFANIASAAQMGVYSGKTVSAYNHLLIAVSVPDLTTSGFPSFVDGGHIDNAFFVRLPGFLAQGGNLSITNQYQIYMDNIGGSANASNAWGLYIADSAYENYFKGSINIDTAAGKVTNSSIGFEIGGVTKALRLPVLTTTQKLALTAIDGMEVFDSTIGFKEVYDGSNWGSGGGYGTSGAVRFYSHMFTSQTSAPVGAADANAGLGATCTVDGTDVAGEVTLVTGSAGFVAGVQCTITFNTAYDSVPKIVFSAGNDNAALANLNVFSTGTTTTFSFNFVNPDIVSTTYKWNYSIYETN